MKENMQEEYQSLSPDQSKVVYACPNNPEVIEWGQVKIQSHFFNVKELIKVMEDLLNNPNIVKFIPGFKELENKEEKIDSKYT